MSWFSGPDPVTELDSKIEEATSESIPNGEMDIAVGLDITDIIRSKRVPPKAAMRSIKKRLTKVYSNPNLLMLTLRLTDLCVKNCGNHFLDEINSKEFVDYLVEYIFKVHYDVKHYQVYSSAAKFAIGNAILKNIKEWSLCLKNLGLTNYLDRVYDLLMKQGYEFPEIDSLIQQFASNFVDSRVPPDWIDGKECMICYNPFSVMNRKHHCRACGGVFCQTHSMKSIPLPAFGILAPVRVCDDCFQIHKGKDNNASTGTAEGPSSRSISRLHTSNSAGGNRRSQPKPDDEEEQIRKAIELSLQESQPSQRPSELPSYQTQEPAYQPPRDAPGGSQEQAAPEEEMDADLKAAIEASLKEANMSPQQSQQPSVDQSLASVGGQEDNEPEAALDLYLNIMPFDTNKYSRPTAPQPGSRTNSYVQPQYTSLSRQFTGKQQQQQQQVRSSRLEAQNTRQQELTDEEEDKIALYIELINNLKNDRMKQKNVLDNQELADLNTIIVQLKPKLNRSLRTAIERYDAFTEMNNKISTITRLYDQFLEDKLNQAYNRHLIASPQYDRQQIPQRRGPQQTPYEAVPSYGRENLGSQYISPQATAAVGGPQPVPQHVRSTIPYPVDSGIMGPAETGRSRHQAQEPPYNVTFPTYPLQPEDESGEGSQGEEVEPAEAMHGNTQEGGSAPVAPTLQQNTGFYPTEPSYSDSDNESVTSRYPALEEPEYQGIQTQATGNREHAKERFPSITQIEERDEESNLPVMQDVQRVPTSASRKYKVEPEPLIEL